MYYRKYQLFYRVKNVDFHLEFITTRAYVLMLRFIVLTATQQYVVQVCSRRKAGKESRYYILPVLAVVNIKNMNVDWRTTLNNI